ncbi:uncharacterized protein EI97DRAFT_378472 [Westerdykella ornata]|uniref:Uncharacterized protein n=1 Tax=Westerdykella ornata TaxID=318751 RepID=A0A6A6JH34_WESOR|nr:uncharacterized protein EI97DRAFT_378472 [Westerdykella ornata]KAF2275871.1 hypothetical protein EI97DRAFT_378472 [Westerdykella ornata]
MWQSGRQQSGTAVSRLSQKFGAAAQVAEIAPPPLRTQHRHRQESVENSPDDDVHSRSSTLGGDEQDFEYPEKTPTSLPKTTQQVHEIKLEENEETAEPPPPPHVPGPLETQLASLMSKLIFMERANPVVSVTPEDYAEMVAELKALREEKKTWQKRHEALFALRDEDVENNIKIRGMLAKARRELEGMTKLRDDDLVNLQAVRAKLAEATRKLDKLEAQSSQTGRSSPSRGHGGRPGSVIMERRGTMDLFAAAKAAALEQRALELEQRNQDLLAQIETLKGGANIDDLNRMTAHKAWKDTVTDLEARLKAKDAQIARLQSGGALTVTGSVSGLELHRVEAIHEEHASYREKMGGKLQALRSEKEALQKELHRKEDENHALEVKIQSLQRRISIL